MDSVGEMIVLAGFGIAILGIAGKLIGIALQLTGLMKRGSVDHRGSLLIFRFARLPMLGISIATVGLVMRSRLPWPFLLVAAVFAVPAIVLLRAEVDFPQERR